MQATRAIVYLHHLRHNIRLIRRRLQTGKKLCVAVKADAYGHGAVTVSRIAVQEGVDMLGVATASEALELREAGIAVPILLFSLPLPGETGLFFNRGVIPMIASMDNIDLLESDGRRFEKKCEVHLKIDTGMGRLGCKPEEALKLALAVSQSGHLRLGGVCTHFPGSDMKDDSFARVQTARFAGVVDAIRKAGIDPGIVHAANSGALIGLPESFFDMARVGILTYGYYPSGEQERILPVKPVMAFCSKVVFIKRVLKGTPISYGMTYRTSRETVIATIAAGYGDGYSRLLSNRGDVCIRGKRYPLAGRVCMDQIMADVGISSGVTLFDDVILFGPQEFGPNAEEIAGLMGTIPYEVTCLVGKRVPRIFVDNDDGTCQNDYNLLP
ncbi:MAG: alanine racemase [Spirochaetales bacterium]|nr:alanine racemase [Spirochaetales bacterium]